MELADRVVIIHKGRVEQAGTPGDVYDRPATAFVASFMGSSNVLTGVAKDGRAALGTIDLPLDGRQKDGADVRAFVRHHDVRILGRAGGDPPPGSAGKPKAKVVGATRVGNIVKLDLELEDGQALVAEVPKEEATALALEEGDEVHVQLGEAAVFVEGYVDDYVI